MSYDISGKFPVMTQPSKLMEFERDMIVACRSEIFSSTEWEEIQKKNACVGQAGAMCEEGGIMDQCLERKHIKGGISGLQKCRFRIMQILPVPIWFPIAGGGAWHTYCEACCSEEVKSKETCINLDDIWFPEPCYWPMCFVSN
jgi:hypothetical protein